MREYRKFILGQIGIDRYISRVSRASSIFLAQPKNTDSPVHVNVNNSSEMPKAKPTKPVNVSNKTKPIAKTITKSTAKPVNPPIANVAKTAEVTLQNLSWDELTTTVNNCRNCELCESRKQPVIGAGDLNPDWLFVGEAPGAEEDLQGLPFMGNSGKMLNNALLSVGINRDKKTYITNALKCRPPGNRPPNIDEIGKCQVYLHAQIALLKPNIIVAVGKSATIALLNDDKTPLGKMRQRVEKFTINRENKLFKDCDIPQSIPVVVTYHPSYIMRNLVDKIKVWEDLVFAVNTLNQKD